MKISSFYEAIVRKIKEKHIWSNRSFTINIRFQEIKASKCIVAVAILRLDVIWINVTAICLVVIYEYPAVATLTIGIV